MESQHILTLLSKSENFIIENFVLMYDFVKSHKGNKKVSKESLIELFDINLKTIIKELEILKNGNNNTCVDAKVNNILKDIINIDNKSNDKSNDSTNNYSDFNQKDNEVLIEDNEKLDDIRDTNKLDNNFQSINERLIRIERALNLNAKPNYNQNKRQFNQKKFNNYKESENN